jgi:hypothetical protein
MGRDIDNRADGYHKESNKTSHNPCHLPSAQILVQEEHKYWYKHDSNCENGYENPLGYRQSFLGVVVYVWILTLPVLGLAFEEPILYS